MLDFRKARTFSHGRLRDALVDYKLEKNHRGNSSWFNNHTQRLLTTGGCQVLQDNLYWCDQQFCPQPSPLLAF